MLGDVIDYHRLMGLADIVADRGFDLEFAPGFQAKCDFVLHAAGDPAVLSDAGHGCKAHSGDAADDVQNGGDGRDRADSFDVALCGSYD